MEIFRALGALIEPPLLEHRELAALLGLGEPPPESLYSDLFLFQLYPYASVYLGSEGMLGGEARDRIAGFWRALGEAPPAECDHLPVMLALYARLGEHESEAEEGRHRTFWEHARRAFFWEHLVSWLPPFLDSLGRIADSYYGRWGNLLTEALIEEARALGPPDALPLHFRDSEPLEDPRVCGGEPFLEALLVPVRSGIITTRSDLDRAARQLDIGSRAGERKFVLKALFSQDPEGTLRWLGREARRWEEIHGARPGVLESVSTFWSARARRTADLLAVLGDDVAG
jgi:hypothetical protein